VPVVAAPVPILVTRIQKSDLVDEALAKRSKCDDTIEQKLLLRTCSLAGVLRPHVAALRSCELMPRPARSQTAARTRLDMPVRPEGLTLFKR